MTLLRTKIKREAKEVIKYTKRKVRKVAKKLSGKPKKKNPIYADLGKITFKELLSGFDKETRDLVYDAYKSYAEVNRQRGINIAKPSQITGTIKAYLKE
jgi:hypothetical protein